MPYITSSIIDENNSPRSLQSARIKANITKPFITATPDRAIKLTSADIDNGISRNPLIKVNY